MVWPRFNKRLKNLLGEVSECKYTRIAAELLTLRPQIKYSQFLIVAGRTLTDHKKSIYKIRFSRHRCLQRNV